MEDGWTVQTYKHPKPSQKRTFEPKVERPIVIKKVVPIVSEVAQAKIDELHKRGIIKSEIERIKRYS